MLRYFNLFKRSPSPGRSILNKNWQILSFHLEILPSFLNGTLLSFSVWTTDRSVCDNVVAHTGYKAVICCSYWWTTYIQVLKKLKQSKRIEVKVQHYSSLGKQIHSCPGEISCPFGCVFSWKCTFLRNIRNCISTASPGNWETGVSNDLCESF